MSRKELDFCEIAAHRALLVASNSECRVAPTKGSHGDHPPICVATDDRTAEPDRLGDEIAELAAHLDAATARLLDLIRWKGLLPRLVRHRRAKVALRPQAPVEGGVEMNSTTIAVDVAKSVFEVAVSEHPGQVRERHRLSRGRFSRFLVEHPPATVVMEACGSAHHWAREAQSRGHRVVLVPPHAARPCVLRNKTDRTDAKGLLEAFRNDDVRPVPVKSETQQALAALHRLRSTWVATRTARLNTLRGILREFGVVIPTGAHHVVPHVRALLQEADAGVPGLLRVPLGEAMREIGELEERIRAIERQLAAAAEPALMIRRLRTIPGIGVLTATALVAIVGDVQRFPSARHFASYRRCLPSDALHPRRALGAASREVEDGAGDGSVADLGVARRAPPRPQ